MGKFIGFLIKSILVIVVLLVVGVVAVSILVDPNDYKDEITQAVKDNTGRTLTLDGDLALSFWPKIGLELGEAELSNADGFGDKPFFAAKQIQVRVKLIPLLSKQLEVDTVVLQGLRLNLAKDSKGKTNWDDLSSAGESAPAETESDGASAGLASLRIGGVELRDAEVLWDDRQAGVSYSLKQLKLVSGEINPGKPVDVELAFDLATTGPARSGHFELQMTVDMDKSMQKIALKPMSLNMNVSG